MNLYLKACFLMVLFLHVALAKFTVAIPVRTIGLFFLTGLLFLLHHKQFLKSFNRSSRVYLVFAAIAFLGGSLGFLHGQSFYVLAENLLRSVIQPAFIFLIVYLAIEIFGLNFVVRWILIFAVVSAVVAILQFMGIGLAWDVRRALGLIQGDPADIRQILRSGSRPMGICFTPIQFSYHLIAGYVLANLLYRQGMMKPWMYAAFTIIALIAAAASGTRSLVLGILVHEGLQLAAVGRFKTYVMLIVGAVLAAGGYYYLQSVGSRVASLQDTSAVSRMALAQFGLHLFIDNPFGFGWGFEPAKLAWLYWEELSHLPKADAVFRIGIHNTFINFLLRYGIFGFCLIAILALTNLRISIALFISFLAYFVNGLFHNAGVFVGDMYFWFAFAVFYYLYEPRHATQPVLFSGKRYYSPAAQYRMG